MLLWLLFRIYNVYISNKAIGLPAYYQLAMHIQPKRVLDDDKLPMHHACGQLEVIHVLVNKIMQILLKLDILFLHKAGLCSGLASYYVFSLQSSSCLLSCLLLAYYYQLVCWYYSLATTSSSQLTSLIILVQPLQVKIIQVAQPEE